MRNHTTKLMFVVCLLLVSGTLWAHHGQGLSFDTNHVWTTWATVDEFDYINPHPAIKFTRTDKDGKVEHWGAEVGNNPSRLARDGWTKGRCMAQLKQGTRVKVFVGTSLAGGFNGIVDRIENEKGEPVCTTGNAPQKVMDLDGVAGGYQPTAADRARAAGAADAAVDKYNKE